MDVDEDVELGITWILKRESSCLPHPTQAYI